MDFAAMESLVRRLPKAELHLHIEGTLEPEMMFQMAARNEVPLPFGSVDEVKAAYRFTSLQSFLDIYYRGAAVLRTEQDFRDLMWAYLERARADGVRHAEVFFDPQTHTARGVGFDVFLPGLHRAAIEAEEALGISSALIMCFLRHRPAEEALLTLRQAEPYLDRIAGVGLDSSEIGHPPGGFAEVFTQARSLGLRAVAHAGEEGPAGYISAALDELGAERIDHGIRCEDDPELVERLRAARVPLTMCPLSNMALQVVRRLEEHNLKRLLDHGLMVTVNSDDPAYFGGYVGDNYLAVARALNLTGDDLSRLAQNSIEASFLSPGRKEQLMNELGEVAEAHGLAIGTAS